MSKDIVPKVKERINEYMIGQGLKRHTLAEKAGISNPTIQNWYTAKNYQPTLTSLGKISGVLKVSLSELFLGENEKMCPVDEERSRLLTMYSKLDKEGRELIFQIMRKFQKD